MEPKVIAEEIASVIEKLRHFRHDQATPINAIVGYAEVLKGEMFGALGHPKYKGFAENIFTSGHALQRDIDSLVGDLRATLEKILAELSKKQLTK